MQTRSLMATNCRPVGSPRSGRGLDGTVKFLRVRGRAGGWGVKAMVALNDIMT
jgi:hypothetical protein